MKRWLEEFCRMEPCFREDGLGGGMTIWEPGERFQAAVAVKQVKNAAFAGAEAATERIVLYYERDMEIEPEDRVARMRDGSLFRIMGEGHRTPDDALLMMARVDCERLVRPL